MSAVNDEAEAGRVQPLVDEESESERQNKDDESEASEGPPIPLLIEPNEGERDGDDLRNKGTSSWGYTEETLDRQENSKSKRSPSLNESLSIPDDTPSIQVIKYHPLI